MTVLLRRDILGGLGSVAANSILPASGMAADSDKYIKDKVRTYGRARGATVGQPGLWWYTGKLWGNRTLDAAVQLFTVHGFSFNRMQLNADGTLLQNMVEVGFWCEPGSFKPADDWVNPINGLGCKPQHINALQKLKFSADGDIMRGSDAPPVELYKGKITDPVVQGDTMWIGEELIIKASVPTPAPPPADPLMQRIPVVTATSLVNYTLNLVDIATPDSQWVPATMSFQSMSGWYSWMRMGMEMGGIMFQLTGKKLRHKGEMPLALQDLINARHPGWLNNPGV